MALANLGGAGFLLLCFCISTKRKSIKFVFWLQMDKGQWLPCPLAPGRAEDLTSCSAGLHSMAPPLKEDPALASNSFILDTVETQKKILLEQGGFVIPEVHVQVLKTAKAARAA